MAIGLNYEQVRELLYDTCSTVASSFRIVIMMAANLGTVGEYVYLWDKLL